MNDNSWKPGDSCYFLFWLDPEDYITIAHGTVEKVEDYSLLIESEGFSYNVKKSCVFFTGVAAEIARRERQLKLFSASLKRKEKQLERARAKCKGLEYEVNTLRADVSRLKKSLHMEDGK